MHINQSAKCDRDQYYFKTKKSAEKFTIEINSRFNFVEKFNYKRSDSPIIK